jgi:hypothetical protein
MRLKELKLLQRHHCNGDFDTITSTLVNNRSLVKLDFGSAENNDTNWAGLCKALRTHPTLDC